MHHQTWGECPQSVRFCRDERCDGQGLVSNCCVRRWIGCHACPEPLNAVVDGRELHDRLTRACLETLPLNPPVAVVRGAQPPGKSRSSNPNGLLRAPGPAPRSPAQSAGNRLPGRRPAPSRTAPRSPRARTTGTAGRDRRRHGRPVRAARQRRARRRFPRFGSQETGYDSAPGDGTAHPRVFRWRPALRSPFIPLRAFAR